MFEMSIISKLIPKEVPPSSVSSPPLKATVLMLKMKTGLSFNLAKLPVQSVLENSQKCELVFAVWTK